MKNKQVSLLASIISLSLLLSSQANAAAENAGEFYLGAKTGWANFDFCETGDCDDDAWGGSVYGGYQFNSWISLEGGYNYLGNSKSYVGNQVTDRTKVDNGELGLKLDWNLGSAWNLFGKIGGTYNDVHSQRYNGSNTVKSDNTSLMAGAGLEYQLSHNWRVRTEYQWFDDVGEKGTGQSDINYVSVGLSYYFGEDKNAAAAAAVVAAPIVAAEPEPVVEPEPAPLPLPAATLSTGAFEHDSTALTGSAKESLTPVATYLEQNPEVNVDVIGYTDSTGAAAYNQKLSEKRAKAAADY